MENFSFGLEEINKKDCRKCCSVLIEILIKHVFTFAIFSIAQLFNPRTHVSSLVLDESSSSIVANGITPPPGPAPRRAPPPAVPKAKIGLCMRSSKRRKRWKKTASQLEARLFQGFPFSFSSFISYSVYSFCWLSQQERKKKGRENGRTGGRGAREEREDELWVARLAFLGAKFAKFGIF